ncbi:MAG: M36 family metallopeptidase, partial [Saprospiraceae bacterium]
NNQGVGDDAIQAEAIDGGGENNANFSTPADGGSGRMQMFRWSRQGGKILHVDSPGPAVGSYFASAASGWGAAITAVPVTGEVVITNDGTGSIDSSKNCLPPVNDLTGKIAMIDRGICEFGQKALAAQQAGAIACIICNFQQGTVLMGAATVGGLVTIPVVMIQKSDADFLKQFVGNGLTISLVQPPAAGPAYLDGDFDNGIMAHEYGHGISTRLTGGPANSGCLGNNEQMGEGWSDFFSLVTAAKPSDNAAKKRGLGNYVVRQDEDGIGIRRYQYSTDMSVNPLSFASVAENTEVHALGEIWAAVTWDLYWALSDKYGYDPHLANPNSGSYRAVQLVMDGLKLQPCSPGFLDGRDAILLADKMNYGGVDTCLIVSVFARRGMGTGSSQGTTDNASDGVQNFDPIPRCIKELKLKKTATPTIGPGGLATFTITVTNHKDNASLNTVVTDELPAGLVFLSASNGGTSSNGVVTWNLGTVATDQVIALTYTAKYPASTGSPLLFEDVLDSDAHWIGLATIAGQSDNFVLQSDVVKVGTAAWKASEAANKKTEMLLEPIDVSIDVSGTQPMLRFWHQYDTEAGADAGFIEVQKEGDNVWRTFDATKVVRGGYTGKVQYSTFAIPYLSGFSGNSGGWIQSYFDMSEYAGQVVKVRFRFGTNTTVGVLNGGWIVDDLQLIDLINFDGQATVTSADGDVVHAKAPEKGVIVDVGATNATQEPTNTLGLSVQPNPADDLLHLRLATALEGPVQVSLFGTDGRVALRRDLQGFAASQVLTLDVQQVPAGMYLLRVEHAAGSSVTKVVIR